MNRNLRLCLLVLALAVPALAQRQPAPPPPYQLTAEERAAVDAKKRQLSDKLKDLRREDRVDAEVFLHVAEISDSLSSYARKDQVASVLRGLDVGLQRCDLIKAGKRPWTTTPGRSLRGYLSRIDGSVQPYGVVLPAGFVPSSKGMRMDLVVHGRGPTEINWVDQFEPARTAAAPNVDFIEVHPFGRGNNGWRWGGETDAFEAFDVARAQYKPDPNRIILRGFSMGGHGSWHIGLQHPDLWAAVSPGAGFTDTRNYLGKDSQNLPQPEAGWRVYDPVDYTLNMANTPFIAYCGDEDPALHQTQLMADTAKYLNVPLEVIIGPKTGHSYHPDSLKELMRRLATHKRNPNPRKISFTTFTLKYPDCHWVHLTGLQEHYRRARVEAEVEFGTVAIRTENVTEMNLNPLPEGITEVRIDGNKLKITEGGLAYLHRDKGEWKLRPSSIRIMKRPRRQGPIDDAYTERFVAVRGTGKPWSEAAQTAADAELKRFQEVYRFGFRAELPVRDDIALTAEEFRGANLILFGDPGSNKLIARIAGRMPIRWTREGVSWGGKLYPGAMPQLVFLNPLSPNHYVVLNSGHTFGMKDLIASNAYLTPRLMDGALVDPVSGKQLVGPTILDERWRIPER